MSDSQRVAGSDEQMQEFYRSWSDKSPELVEHDIRVAMRKVRMVLSSLPQGALAGVETVLDFGCGYGSSLRTLADELRVKHAVGVDFSDSAIAVAKERFADETVDYEVVPSLDPGEIGEFLACLLPGGADCVLLLDVLEHVPDCRALMASLSRTSDTFIIKLPLENSVFDNYVRRKEYPSSIHSNGHLREFTVNNVHYFVRGLGLTPIYENVYLYSREELFPPPQQRLGMLQRVKRVLHIAFRRGSARLLPKRLFLRLVGGGGYYCVAKYCPSNVLVP